MIKNKILTFDNRIILGILLNSLVRISWLNSHNNTSSDGFSSESKFNAILFIIPLLFTFVLYIGIIFI